jgi:hypothetical protein
MVVCLRLRIESTMRYSVSTMSAHNMLSSESTTTQRMREVFAGLGTGKSDRYKRLARCGPRRKVKEVSARMSD